MKHVSMAVLAGVTGWLCMAPVQAQVQAQVAAPADDGYYVAARLQGAKQQISDQQRYSPRVQGLARGPRDDDGRATSVGLALGYRLADQWRVEAEYVTPSTSDFESQWRFSNPATGATGISTNTLQLRTQRLMFNVYRDFALSTNWSAYAGLGLGLARIDASGYQNAASRRFEARTSNNLAWSATIGVDYHINRAWTVGMGYRYVDLGRYTTGRNTFATPSGQRDEQHSGRLKEQSFFLESRYNF